MATALTTRPNNVDLTFGTHGDLTAFARRIKLMCKGGDKLREDEALALAQVATVTHLNPFIGEVWYIPGSGPMVGIAGARRVDQEATRERGGYSTVEVISCPPEEAGALESEVKDVAAAFRAEITDTAATLEYQKMFTATLASLRECGETDPVKVAREICGPRPKWVGYGFSKKNESTRMGKVQAARKRAEADALKKKITLPFGAEVAEVDVNPDYVDVTAQDVAPKRTQAENMSDLGFEEAQFDADFPPADKPTEVPTVQMYKYNSHEIIVTVAKTMGYTDKNATKDAAQVLYEARKANRIADNLTIQEAIDFAAALVAPK
jgi:hypothetical protein